MTAWNPTLRALLQAALLAATLALLFALDLYGPTRHGDVDLYHRYAVSFWGAQVPFQQLPAEYPPLAVLAFSLSALPPAHEYAAIFGAWMVVLFLAGFLAIQRLFSRRAAVLYLVYVGVGGAGTLLSRYDLLPALVTVVALAAVQRRRFQLAYVLLALGTLLKLYPIFLVPAVMIEQQRQLGAGLRPARPVLAGGALALAIVAAGFAAAYLLAGGDALSTFSYARSRPFQVESVPATLLWLLSAAGPGVRYDHSFSSFNLVSDAAGAVSILSSLALAAGCLWIWARQLRGQLPIDRAFLALVCVAIVTSRVLSPQYVIWVLPLVAVSEGFNLVWLLVAVLTTAIWPVGYLAEGLHGQHHYYSPGFLLLIAARNLVLSLATGRLLRPARPEPARQPAVAIDRPGLG